MPILRLSAQAQHGLELPHVHFAQPEYAQELVDFVVGSTAVRSLCKAGLHEDITPRYLPTRYRYILATPPGPSDILPEIATLHLRPRNTGIRGGIVDRNTNMQVRDIQQITIPIDTAALPVTSQLGPHKNILVHDLLMHVTAAWLAEHDIR